MTLAVTPTHIELLTKIRSARGRPRVVVIGAAAIQHHVVLPRVTADVDLAIVAEPNEVDRLVEKAGWVRDGRATQRWRHPTTENIVDVLAATERILRQGHMRVDGDQKEMSMVGFDLAVSNTVTIVLGGA